MWGKFSNWYIRRTRAMKIEWIMRCSRNARIDINNRTRKIQRTCKWLLIKSFNNSRGWESLLNQRMSDSLYHYCRNIMMKQMSMMKKYMISWLKWSLRSSNICINGSMTWSNRKNIKQSIFVMKKNTLMSIKCLKL